MQSMLNLVAAPLGSPSTSITLPILNEYVRPTDWPDLPIDTVQQVVIVAAVWNNSSNYCSLSATAVGGYFVDWGDGVIEAVGTGVQRNHLYSFSNVNLSAVTSKGYKCAIIKIYPQIPGNVITAFNGGLKNPATNLSNGSNPWLDIRINLPNCTNLILRTTTCEARFLQRVQVTAIGAVTTLASLFQNCSSLLSAPTWPVGSLASVNSLASTFAGCCALITIPAWPVGSLSLVTTLSSTFSGCYALITIPAWPAGSLAVVNTLASTFQNCFALLSLPAWPNNSLSLVTTILSAFNGCYVLVALPAWPNGALNSLSVTTTAFSACPALAKIPNCIIKVAFSVASCRLGAAELNEIYTALPVVVGRTITVTGNYGISLGHTPSIATAKGWTVTV